MEHFARVGTPPFFFLVGYAESRTVPLYWIWLGVILTVLDSWNAEWTWVAPNILLSFALIRIARPYVNNLVQRYGWAAFAFLVLALLVVVPPANKLVDYGAEGWLWALFGLFQRRHGNGDRLPAPAKLESGHQPIWMTENPRLMRLLACIVAAVVYVWQEQKEFNFPPIQFAVFTLEIGVLSIALCLFMRGPESNPTERAHSRGAAFHRQAHTGNLRNSACGLRAPDKIRARSCALRRKQPFKRGGDDAGSLKVSEHDLASEWRFAPPLLRFAKKREPRREPHAPGACPRRARNPQGLRRCLFDRLV